VKIFLYIYGGYFLFDFLLKIDFFKELLFERMLKKIERTKFEGKKLILNERYLIKQPRYTNFSIIKLPGESPLAQPFPRLTTPMTKAFVLAFPKNFQRGPPESPVQAS
jgi:hypothetical protein